ncbi:MAG: extracellular solute-binding protein [Gaiellaceae bacterium]
MRPRFVAAAALAASLAVTATASGTIARTTTPSSAKATTLTIWLQVDAQQNWADVVAAATQAFKQQHADVDVNVEYQTWGDHLTKFDATLAGGTAPDVIEMGNTEMTKYMAAGAFTDLTPQKASFPNSSTWLGGLAASSTYRGRLYGVPYYAGARAVIYRKDLYRQAGIKAVPKSIVEFQAAGNKLMKKFGKDRNFSAVYFPGRYWYASMAFVYDYGGAIARFRNGRWVGTLDSPQAIRGLNVLKFTVNKLSRANKTGDEANPAQALVFAKGKVGSIIANGWEWGYSLDPKVGNPKLAPTLGAYPMPSHTKGKFMPTFLGGSDLAVPVSSKNKALAIDWIKAFTSTGSQRQLANVGKVIPNTTSLASIHSGNPQLAPFAQAARSSWFVPTSPNWVNVESANILQNMLVSIFTGRSSVAAAAKRASTQITNTLNANP